MSLYSDTLSSFQAKRYILTPLYGMLSGEAANTNFIVYFDPTRSQTQGLPQASTLTITTNADLMIQI